MSAMQDGERDSCPGRHNRLPLAGHSAAESDGARDSRSALQSLQGKSGTSKCAATVQMFLAAGGRRSTFRAAARCDSDRTFRIKKNSLWRAMMKYPDGQEVRLGDRVKLGRNEQGIVV